MKDRGWPMWVRRTCTVITMLVAIAVTSASVAVVSGCANGTIANISDVRVKVVKKACTQDNAEVWTIKTHNTAGGMNWPMVVVTRTGNTPDHVWYNGTLVHGKEFDQDFTVPANGLPVDVLVDRQDMYKSGEWYPSPYYHGTFGNDCKPKPAPAAPKVTPKPVNPSGSPKGTKATEVHSAGNGHLSITMAHFCGDTAWTITITNTTSSTRKAVGGRSFTKHDPITLAPHTSMIIQVPKSDLHSTSVEAMEMGDPNFVMRYERRNC